MYIYFECDIFRKTTPTLISGSLADLPLPTGLKLTPLNQTSLSLSWDSAPVTDLAKDDWFYMVECEQVKDAGTAWSFQLPLNSTNIQLNQLRPRQKYKCSVSLSSRAAGQNCPTVSAWTLSDGQWDLGPRRNSLSRHFFIRCLDHSSRYDL